MPRFEVKQSSKLHLTSYSGLALIGQCCQLAQVEAVIDPKIPVSQGMRTSDIVKSVVGLLSLGKSDFEAIEAFRGGAHHRLPGLCLRRHRHLRHGQQRHQEGSGRAHLPGF